MVRGLWSSRADDGVTPSDPAPPAEAPPPDPLRLAIVVDSTEPLPPTQGKPRPRVLSPTLTQSPAGPQELTLPPCRPRPSTDSTPSADHAPYPDTHTLPPRLRPQPCPLMSPPARH